MISMSNTAKRKVSKMLCKCSEWTLAHDLAMCQFVCVQCGTRYTDRFMMESNAIRFFRVLTPDEQQAIEDEYFDKLFGVDNEP